ncbi:MAG: RNA polymerase sigma factor [Actinomycetota bacterium]
MFHGSRELFTWSCTIARHAALDELRRRDCHARPFSGLTEPVQARELLAAVQGSGLSVGRMLLREYEAKSYREIREFMGCTEVNPRVLTHRARRAIRVL